MAPCSFAALSLLSCAFWPCIFMPGISLPRLRPPPGARRSSFPTTWTTRRPASTRSSRPMTRTGTTSVQVGSETNRDVASLCCVFFTCPACWVCWRRHFSLASLPLPLPSSLSYLSPSLSPLSSFPASVLRHVYLRPCGVGALQKVYGGQSLPLNQEQSSFSDPLGDKYDICAHAWLEFVHPLSPLTYCQYYMHKHPNTLMPLTPNSTP